MAGFKGGHERYVDVQNLEQTALLGEIVSVIRAKKLQANDYVITNNVKGGVEKQIKSIQNWLSNHRYKFIDSDRTKTVQQGYKPKSNRITFHGLRHSFEQQFEKEVEMAKDPHAMKKISAQLGHYREAITKIYSDKK